MVFKRSTIFLLLLLSFIGMDEVCSNAIIGVLTELSTTQEILLLLVFFLLQMVLAPIQAGYSDFYCRKKSLMVTMTVSTVSIGLIYLSVLGLVAPIITLSVVVLLKAALGNTLPIAWAGLADTQDSNIRFSLGLSTTSIALGYLILSLLNKHLGTTQVLGVILILFLGHIFLGWKYFEDVRNDNIIFRNDVNRFKLIIKDIKLLWKDFLLCKRVLLGLLSFLMWEISYYSVHMLDVDMKLDEFKNLTAFMIMGYCVGTVILKVSKKSDWELMRYGYIISFISLLPIFISFPFFGHLKHIAFSCYTVNGMGSALLAPSIFSILSKERESHEQGKIYGLIDSTDSVALLVTFLVVIKFTSLQLNPIYIYTFSFLNIVFSVFAYASFKKAYREKPKRYY